MALHSSASTGVLCAVVLAVTACSGPSGAETAGPRGSGDPPAAPPSTSEGADQTAEARPATPDPTPGESVVPVGTLSSDTLVTTVVSGLRVRAEPSLHADRLGEVPAEEVAFVVDGPVEADGYDWYYLSSDTGCSEAADTEFGCQPWIGWVAATALDGTRWLEPLPDACPGGPLDLEAYLDTTALTRLACFGDETWTLRAFIAPSSGGRGGTSLFRTEPPWLDAWGSLVFPQIEPSELDESSALAMHAHPDMRCEFGGRNPECDFAEFEGAWVIITGHHDDPAARTCVPTYNTIWTDSMEPPLPPLPDVAGTVLGCRAAFIATSVVAAP